MEDIKTHKISIYNDAINEFGYIIACLIRFCNHEPLQAEQCAIIADNAGKCHVKSGSYEEMFNIKTTFKRLDIKTKIEEYENSSLH
jgi:ATP-dependent Clp protease adaptor protein ClpS